jgi:hypothetical protein
MLRTGLITVVLLAGCDSVEPSDSMWSPATEKAVTDTPKETSDTTAPPKPTGEAVPIPAPMELSPDGDGKTEGAASQDLAGEVRSPVELMASLDSSMVAGAVPNARSESGTTTIGFPAHLVAQPTGATWGVRLVSTVVDAQPPRAILGLPDGSEAAVRPGTLLPDVGVIVLAIGQDQVQIAEVKPNGDHARITTRMVTSMYPDKER